MTSDRKPGANDSISASMRSANVSLSLGVPDARQVAARVTAHAQRHVGVRPHRLRARRRPGGVGGVHLAGEHERVRGDAVLREVGRVRGDAVHAVAQVDGARASLAASVRHGIGPESAQSTLNVARSYWNRVEVVDHPCGQVLLADEVAVERRRTDVGEHAAGRGDRLAVGQDHGDGAAVAHLDPLHAGVAPHHAAPLGESPDQGGGQLPGAALGDGEAVLLAHER